MATLIFSPKPTPSSRSNTVPQPQGLTQGFHPGKNRGVFDWGTVSSPPSVLTRNREMRKEMRGIRKRMSVWVQINKDSKLHRVPREIKCAPKAFHSDETLKTLFGTK